MRDSPFIDLDWTQFLTAFARLLAALVLGALIGWQREHAQHWAGLRTHVLVTLAAAAFMIVGEGLAQDSDGAATRVVQGITIGIGFLGAGTILKLPRERRIEGLTTAGGIWTAAAIGVAVGSGRVALASVLAVLAFLVLQASNWIEDRSAERKP